MAGLSPWKLSARRGSLRARVIVRLEVFDVQGQTSKPKERWLTASFGMTRLTKTGADCLLQVVDSLS